LPREPHLIADSNDKQYGDNSADVQRDFVAVFMIAPWTAKTKGRRSQCEPPPVL